MGEVRDLINQLVESGVDPLTAAEVVTRAAIEGAKTATAPGKSKGAERQARYRERNKASQNVTDRNEASPVTDTGKESPPDPQKKTTPPKPPKGGIFPPRSFEIWYDEYPHKVGKKAAFRAFEKVRKSGEVEFQTLLDGLARYKSSKPKDRDWCNPATWLNQGRWDDGRPINVPLQVSSPQPTVFVQVDSDEWDAWQATQPNKKLVAIQTTNGMGRYFPSKTPPQDNSEAA